MENEFILSYKRVCDWWRRPDLEPGPENMERVREVLEQAEIKVFQTKYSSDGWLVCEPRPDAIYEALSGDTYGNERNRFLNYPTEEPGKILRILAKKGIYQPKSGKSSS